MAKKSKLVSPDRIFNEEDPKVELLQVIGDKEVVLSEEFLTLEMHRNVLLEGSFQIENLGGGDVHVNDKVLYFGDSIKVEGTVLICTTCYPKIKLTRYNV